jgi:glycosyltransferase involved in cell wall biosynthesis
MPSRKLSRLFLMSGCDRGEAMRYRCYHKQEQLALLGIPATVKNYFSDAYSPAEAADYDLLILHRVPYDDQVGALIARAQELGQPVVYDTDDLVFEPGLTQWVRALAALPVEDLELYHQGVRRYRATLERCDAVLVTGEYLARLVQALGKPAFVDRNALDGETIALAETISAIENRKSKIENRLTLAYFSGTNTHDYDFAQAADAVADVMERYPQVDLLIVGPLHLDERLQRFGKRVRHLPLVPWQQLPALIAQADVNLAPLEPRNPYCRAKSELKYFEAAILGVPTVASRIDPFEYAITPGRNGLLAGSPAEWRSALELLVNSAALRCELGEVARTDAYARYTPAARAPQLVATLEEMLAAKPDRSGETCQVWSQVGSGRSLVINWLVSEPFQGSGGHTNIFRIAGLLASFGHQVNLYVDPGVAFQNKDVASIADFLRQHFGVQGMNVYRGWQDVQEGDAVIATFWVSAYAANRCTNNSRRFYFVQDFEPLFYPMSSEYLYAEQTYRFPFHALTLGHWLAHLVQERYNMPADPFDFGLEPQVYYPRPLPRSAPPRILFYAQPIKPRRSFQLGVDALELVHKAHPEVEIVFFGAANLLGQHIPFPYTNKGILTPDRLAELYSSATVGLSLSPTNPSFVPIEMLACRCPVVELRGETVEGLLVDGVNALLAEPTPAALAAAVCRLLVDQALRERLASNGYHMAQGLSWERSARQVEAVLLRETPPSPVATGEGRVGVPSPVATWESRVGEISPPVPPVEHWPQPPKTLLGRAWLVWRTRGVRALWRETRAYLQWRISGFRHWK